MKKLLFCAVSSIFLLINNIGFAATDNFKATVTVNDACTVSVIDMAFAAQTVAGGNIPGDSTATSTYQVTCGLPTTGWTLSADGGTHGNLAQRQMKLTTGPDVLNYQLYRDVGRLEVWGDGTGGTFTITGIGSTGAPVTYYGDLPGQAVTAAGNYDDDLVATITP